MAETVLVRSDAARNREAIVRAAGELFRRDGAAASLNEIAEHAGVGSATLHRHFEGRRALLAAVFADTVITLAAGAERPPVDDPGTAMWTWLEAVLRHCAGDLVLAAAVPAGTTAIESHRSSWEPLRRAGEPLLAAAKSAGGLRADLTIDDLLDLVYAVARASAGQPDRAVRLWTLVRDGARTTSVR